MELILQAIKALLNKVNIQLRELAKLAVPANWEAPEDEPGHVLNRTHYFESKPYEFPSITLTNPSDGGFVLTTPLELIPGREYTVTFNGVEYVTKCQHREQEDLGAVNVLGNGAFAGVEATEDPFTIVAFEIINPLWGWGMVYANYDSITFSVKGDNGTVKTLDPIFFPPVSPYPAEILWIDGETNGGTDFTATSGHTWEDLNNAFEAGKNIIIRLKIDGRATVILHWANENYGRFNFMGTWPPFERLWLDWQPGSTYLHHLAFDDTEKT